MKGIVTQFIIAGFEIIGIYLYVYVSFFLKYLVFLLLSIFFCVVPTMGKESAIFISIKASRFR